MTPVTAVALAFSTLTTTVVVVKLFSEQRGMLPTVVVFVMAFAWQLSTVVKLADAMVNVVFPPVVDTAVPLHSLMLFVTVPAFENDMMGMLLRSEYNPVNDAAFGRLIEGVAVIPLVADTDPENVEAPDTARAPPRDVANAPTVRVLL